jgi:hypothetical protein
LHLIKRATEISGLDALDDRAAFVADDIREITAIERQQESATFWSTKIRVRKNVFRRIHVLSVCSSRAEVPVAAFRLMKQISR